MSSLATVSAVLALAAPIVGPAGRLHVDDGGRGGLPVVFVHSFAGSSGHWAAQLAHLRPARRAVALDLRGHGRSQAPGPEGYAVDALASDIAAVVDRLVLVGTPGKTPLVVYPAAAIPETVAAQGAPMVIINREPTPLDVLAAVALRGEVERLLPALVDGASPA